jgi:hypothetical protein
VLDLRPDSAPLTESVEVVSSASRSIHDPTQIANPDSEVAPKNTPKEASSAWAAASTLLDTLELGAEAFPPAKLVISGLKLFVNALSVRSKCLDWPQLFIFVINLQKERVSGTRGVQLSGNQAN